VSDDEDDTAQVPSRKSAKRTSLEQAKAVETESVSEEDEESDSMSVDEEPDPKAKKNVAQKL